MNQFPLGKYFGTNGQIQLSKVQTYYYNSVPRILEMVVIVYYPARVLRPHKMKYLFLGHISPQIDKGMIEAFFNCFVLVRGP
jgi:hypothetical protein